MESFRIVLSVQALRHFRTRVMVCLTEACIWSIRRMRRPAGGHSLIFNHAPRGITPLSRDRREACIQNTLVDIWNINSWTSRYNCHPTLALGLLSNVLPWGISGSGPRSLCLHRGVGVTALIAGHFSHWDYCLWFIARLVYWIMFLSRFLR